jgi:hypothetical protein
LKMQVPVEEHLASMLDMVRRRCGFVYGHFRPVPLAGDGSQRRFFRIRDGKTSYILLVAPRQKPEVLDENDSYFLIGRHLESRKLSVPRIMWADPETGCFLLQDLGDCHLQKHARRGHVRLENLYSRAVRLLAGFHQRAAEGFEASFCFDTPLYDPPFIYERELEYFRRAFLETALGLSVPGEELQRDFECLAEAAGTYKTTQVLHRDFQSRNLMICNGRIWIIDFQGMRFGPSVYDLASLLSDPYVMLPFRLQEKLVDLYWRASRPGFPVYSSYGHFREHYRYVRLCRNLQVLGAFGNLGVNRGKTQFLQYIPAAWKQAWYWLQGPCRGQFPNLQKSLAQAGTAMETSLLESAQLPRDMKA